MWHKPTHEFVTLCGYTWDTGPQTKAHVAFGLSERECQGYGVVLFSDLEIA